ncbi:MAG: hypothetical protein JOS17DRAFT_770810 [Linnemannia elongata]|nr:MAG: hypothetical protein JOS17DRAFT_770810 [Linnemannia elongata]
MSQKVYNCFFSDCGLQFTVLYDWTSHMRKHAANRYLSLYLRSPSLYLPAELKTSNVMPSAASGSGTGVGARGRSVRAEQRTTVTSALVASPKTGTASALRMVAGETVSKPRTSSTATTSPHDLTRDRKPSHDDPKPSSWSQALSTTSAMSSNRPSTTAPILRTTPKETATPLSNSNLKNFSTQEKLPSTSTPSTLPAGALFTASLERSSSLPVGNSTRLDSPLLTTSPEITKHGLPRG